MVEKNEEALKREVQLRPLLEDDIPLLVALLHRDLSAYKPNVMPEFFDVNLMNGCRVVALVGGEVVGYASLLIETNIRGGKLGHIEDVVVEKMNRGKGIARLMLEFLTKFAVAEGCYKLGLASTREAEKFYEKLEFKNTANYYTKQL